MYNARYTPADQQAKQDLNVALQVVAFFAFAIAPVGVAIGLLVLGIPNWGMAIIGSALPVTHMLMGILRFFHRNEDPLCKADVNATWARWTAWTIWPMLVFGATATVAFVSPTLVELVTEAVASVIPFI